jgi:hypothetical protein
MKSLSCLLVVALAMGLMGADRKAVSAPARVPATPSYVIANDDLPPRIPTSGTFFPIGANGSLQAPARVSMGGVGSGGGYFASNRVSVLNSSTAACAYLSMGASAEISGIDIQSLLDIGNFAASDTDSGFDNGVGMTNNGTYLFAAFGNSNTIGTFVVQPGCGLQFLSDITTVGKHGSSVKGLAVHGNLLVVTYGDGSIQSFNVAAGTPVSNNDLQDATGYLKDYFPVGVDITEDGHYAIFGDAANYMTIEVSDISSGKLTKTKVYRLGFAFNSNNVRLSPDGTLLYIVNTTFGSVSAAFFDKTTGAVTQGCMSGKLKGFDDAWAYLSSPVTQLNSGTGSVLYVAEFGGQSGVAALNITSSAGKCTLKEATGSPFIDPNTTNLLSIGVYPPRSF